MNRLEKKEHIFSNELVNCMYKGEDAGISKRVILPISIIILFSYTMALVLPKHVFYRLIREDGLIESLTAVFFLITSVSLLLLFLNTRKMFLKASHSFFRTISQRYFFLLLAFTFFFGFGEEISWGQRIFNFETPDFIAKSNTQKEFTIHNLELFDGKNMIGTPKAIFVRLFTMKQLFLYAFFFYLLIIPLLNNKYDSCKFCFRKIRIPIAPVWLGWLFVGNFIVYAILRMLLKGQFHPEFMHGITEIQELNFSIILILLPFLWMQIERFKLLKS